MNVPRRQHWSEAGRRVGCVDKLPDEESLTSHVTLDKLLKLSASVSFFVK